MCQHQHLIILGTTSFNELPLQVLLPSNINSASSFSELDEVISFYSDDLPNDNILDEELCRWKSKWLHVPVEDRPKT